MYNIGSPIFVLWPLNNELCRFQQKKNSEAIIFAFFGPFTLDLTKKSHKYINLANEKS